MISRLVKSLAGGSIAGTGDYYAGLVEVRN